MSLVPVPGGSASVTRRGALVAMLAMAAPRPGGAAAPMRFGLTPVFVTDDLRLLGALEQALSAEAGATVTLVMRRTYREVTELLLAREIDAAWICGYPFVQHAAALTLLAAPLWRGASLYQSYLIVGAGDPAEGLDDLKGSSHAFSDPDSNSGWLVTAAALAERGERPAAFFDGAFFTYSHRNVVRAVASGLARSGSVDGYVWEVLAETEPALTERTRVVARSEPLGFPPVACARAHRDGPQALALERALLNLGRSAEGAEALQALRLDGFGRPDASLFAGIAARADAVSRLG